MPFLIRSEKWLWRICAAFFIAVCLLHFFSQRPLWLDENFVFGHIRQAGYRILFDVPLDHSQAFPRVYLLVIKFFAQQFSLHLLALRFMPLVCMGGAFFVWKKIYRASAATAHDALLCAAAFVSSYQMGRYASELKQYSMDVLVVGLFCLYLLSFKGNSIRKPTRAFTLITLALPFSLFFSYAGFFIFWVVAYNLAREARKNHSFGGLCIGYAGVSLLLSAWIFYFDIRHTLAVSSLFSYWDDYFLCVNSAACFFKSFGEGMRRLGVWWFGNSKFFVRAATFVLPFFLFSLLGHGFVLLKKERFMVVRVETIGVVLFLELFVCGVFKKFPFTGERVTLYFAPFVFFYIVQGFGFLRRNRVIYNALIGCFCLFLLLCAGNTVVSFLGLYR